MRSILSILLTAVAVVQAMPHAYSYFLPRQLVDEDSNGDLEIPCLSEVIFGSALVDQVETLAATMTTQRRHKHKHKHTSGRAVPPASTTGAAKLTIHSTTTLVTSASSTVDALPTFVASSTYIFSTSTITSTSVVSLATTMTSAPVLDSAPLASSFSLSFSSVSPAVVVTPIPVSLASMAPTPVLDSASVVALAVGSPILVSTAPALSSPMSSGFITPFVPIELSTSASTSSPLIAVAASTVQPESSSTISTVGVSPIASILPGIQHAKSFSNDSPYPGFSVTWSDDFSGSAGSPSSSNWQFDVGTSYPGGPYAWGTGEREAYTSSFSNVALDGNGALILQPTLKNGLWCSARIESVQDNFQCQPGGKMIIEASINLPASDVSTQQGLWPAFWAMGTAFRKDGNTGWPGTGEWDILEAVDGQSIAHGTVHCGTAPGGPCNEYTGITGGVSFTRGEYHTFGVQLDRTATTWEGETVSFLLDGVAYTKVTGSQVGDADAWANLVHKPFFIIFNVAVGGGWPGSPNSNTASGLSSGMSVDYVAVYNSN